MLHPIRILVGAQMLFTISDLLARHHMEKGGFVLANFLTSWFALYFLIRMLAMFGQLYVFTHVELGRTMALFGAVSIVLSNILGFLLLGELLTTTTYVGIMLAVVAFLVLAVTL